MYELIELRSSPGEFVIKKTDEDGTEFWIPMDENNSDYQAYLTEQEEVK